MLFVSFSVVISRHCHVYIMPILESLPHYFHIASKILVYYKYF
jgi:hypothetical protein